MAKLAIGVIGCGAMARDLAKRCVALGARVTAVSDPDPDALARASAELDALPVEDYRKLCSRTDVEAVIVGSPPGNHLENVLAAAEARKPVYCEKPLGISVAQCDRMIAACREAGVPLFVGQVLRLFPLFWQSRVLIDEGKIGVPRAVSVTRVGYGTVFHSGWRKRRDLAGGLLLEVNAHEFDYMRFLLGEPAEVYARLDNILGGMEYEDQAFVTVAFQNGSSGMLHSSFSSPIGEYRVHIQGSEGNIIHGGFGGTLKYKRLDGEEGEFRPDDVGVANPYDRELASWIASVTSGEVPLFTGEDGRAVVAMAEAAYRSAERDQPVSIADL